MSALTDYRAAHPEYNSIGDSDLADALYAHAYADKMPRDQFDAKIGLHTSGQLAGSVNPMAVVKPGAKTDSLGNPVPDLGQAPPVAPNDLGAGNAFAGGVISGVPIAGPVVKGWIDDIVAHLQGGNPDQNRQAIEAANKATNEAHPVAAGAGNLTGGIAGYGLAAGAAPALFGAGSASLPLRAGIAGLTNAGIAGGDTAVRGGSSNDILNSAGTGFGLGMAAPVAGAIVGGIARPVARAFSSWAGAPGVPGMRSSAANVLADALTTDNAIKNVPARLQNLGPEAMTLDAGPTTQGWAIGVSRDPGAPRTKIINALVNREQGADPRMMAGMNQSFGPAINPADLTDALKSARGVVHQDIPTVLAAAPPIDISQAIGTIGQGLTKTVGPEAAALQKVRSYLIQNTSRGPKPITDAFKVQSAKKAIDDLIQYGDQGLGVAPGVLSSNQGAFGLLRSQVNDALRSQVPGYAAIMDKSSGIAKQIDQVVAGRDVLDSGKSALHPDTLDAEWPNLTPGQQLAKQIGTRSEIDRALGQNKNDRAAVAKVLGGEGDWNRQKLGTMYGQQPTDEAIRLANAEAEFQQAHRDIVRPAQTAAGLRAAKMANPGTESGSGAHSGILAAVLGGPAEAATYAGLRGLQKGWRGVRNAMTAGRNNDLASALVAQNPALVDALIQRGAYREGAGKPTAAALSALTRALVGYEGSVRRGQDLPSPRTIGGTALGAGALLLDRFH